MSDLIERQAAKEVGRMTRAEFIERLKKLIEEAENDERTEKSSQNVSNGDSISRKAAIDAMCELMRHWFGCNPKDEIKEIKRELDKLPAAQPEIIRCKDCSKRPYCKTSTAWAVVPDDDWFCGDAERKDND